jgi:hypothetical protein
LKHIVIEVAWNETILPHGCRTLVEAALSWRVVAPDRKHLSKAEAAHLGGSGSAQS